MAWLTIDSERAVTLRKREKAKLNNIAHLLVKSIKYRDGDRNIHLSLLLTRDTSLFQFKRVYLLRIYSTVVGPNSSEFTRNDET